MPLDYRLTGPTINTITFGMKFDIFHSIGRVDSVEKPLSDVAVFHQFFEQAVLAESLGFQTVWVAESHFSSEVQKKHTHPVIPNYKGEVGLNTDSMQLAQILFGKTEKIGFGTAILNIVGGNGGPIAAADRVRMLAFINSMSMHPRKLHVGVAAGRFPYINKPFGIVPRDKEEALFWGQYTPKIFIEALEIFLRLSAGEAISSRDVSRQTINRSSFRLEEDFTRAKLAAKELGIQFGANGVEYKPRWDFDYMQLVPHMTKEHWSDTMNFVLGSHDPNAREVGLKWDDMDIFNLSFTPPEKLDLVHQEMFKRYEAAGRKWHRSRMPRTVLVFIDNNSSRAWEKASSCFDTYIEAMRGTVQLPPKEELMARALIGDPSEIREQLAPGGSRGVHEDDRLMLWFEFNQTDNESIKGQMQLFSEEVMGRVS